MPEDAAGAGMAEGDAGTAAGTETAEGAGGAGAPAAGAASPGVADQSAEALLAAAMNAPEDDGAADAGDDPAKQLAAARAEAKKWRELSRKTEAQAKKGADAQKRLAEIEEANKTEAQKLADRAAAAEAARAEAEAKYHRTLAAAQYGLPPALIDRIAGGTEDEITESAETLAAVINEQVETQVAARIAALTQNGGSRGTRPVESMRPGAIPASDAAKNSTNPNVAFRQLLTGGQQ
jgi:Domain of unknown function (DUF4355)